MLSCEKVAYRYGEVPLLTDCTLSLEAGEIGCLLGPSGSGKTTVLRLIAGFIAPASGTIRLAGAVVADATRWVPAHRRRVGMVFQDHALFPHLTVAQNVAFGLQALDKAGRDTRVAELLELVGLTHAACAYPHELSGGQQQRVALARALAPKPRLLLMDEPFSSLDAGLREYLAQEVRAILKHEGITALMVTHDQAEALAIADRVGVLHDGQLAQWDTPYAVYHEPKSRFVAEFVGEGAFVRGQMYAGCTVSTIFGELQCRCATCLAPGSRVEVLLRPDDVVLDENSELIARIVEARFRGSMIRYRLSLPDNTMVLLDHPSHEPLRVGMHVGVALDVRHVVVFPATNEDESLGGEHADSLKASSSAIRQASPSA